MAEIRPFQGLRYSISAGKLDDLVAPPYDVLSSDERDAFAAKNEHNVVHLTLPEQRSDDRSKFVKYARSAAALAQWRREGALALEAKPVFYRYKQTFVVPGTRDEIARTSVIALIKVEPYEKGVVLPHEQTFPKHKEDRLRILEATRSHLECIYGLFEDQDGRIFSSIDGAPAERVADVRTSDGVRHIIETISDNRACNALSMSLASKKVWIADGHHRYETACTFREAQGKQGHLIPEDYMMMALSSMSDPGLVLLPTHRILSKLPVEAVKVDEVLQRYFNLRKLPNGSLMNEISLLHASGTRAFGVALPGGAGWVATVSDLGKICELIDSGDSEQLKSLDVSILHKLILEKMFGVVGLDAISYTRDSDEAVNAVKNGAAAAFLMNPPSVQDMKSIAVGGEKMPQKSTFYYPKILSGLVMWSLNDFEP